MGSTTPLLDTLAGHLPPDIPAADVAALDPDARATLETLLAYALGADCPPRLPPDARQQWSRTQPAALRALQDALATRAPKRPRTSHDPDDLPAAQKRPKTDGDGDDPPRFTLPGISTTSPVRKKVDISVHARSIRFLNPASRALEATVPLATIARAFLLPTRGKTRGHWTVVLLPADVPDKSKSAQQVIFGLDALAPASFDTTAHADAGPTTTTTIPKGAETAPAVRQLLAHVPVPLLGPSATVFRSACATPKAGDGAAGVDAYLAAKAGTLWFLDTGILWGESKPCAFWAVADLLPKDGVRLISATGRTCSVILSRQTQGQGEDDAADDVVETVFAMVDGREQDPISAWARNRKHVMGKPVAGSASSSQTLVGNGKDRDAGAHQNPLSSGTVKGPAWDDSDPDDDDFEASSEDLEHSSQFDSEGEGREGSGGEDGGVSGEESGDESLEEEEELQEAHHPLLRPGAMPRMSRAAIDMIVDMVQADLVDDGSEEEDELEE